MHRDCLQGIWLGFGSFFERAIEHLPEVGDSFAEELLVHAEVSFFFSDVDVDDFYAEHAK